MTGNENVKKIFVLRIRVRQKWIDLRQTKTKIISGLFYTSNTFRQWKFEICVCHCTHLSFAQ